MSNRDHVCIDQLWAKASTVLLCAHMPTEGSAAGGTAEGSSEPRADRQRQLREWLLACRFIDVYRRGEARQLTLSAAATLARLMQKSACSSSSGGGGGDDGDGAGALFDLVPSWTTGWEILYEATEERDVVVGFATVAGGGAGGGGDASADGRAEAARGREPRLSRHAIGRSCWGRGRAASNVVSAAPGCPGGRRT